MRPPPFGPDNGGWLSVTNEPSHGYSITWSYSDSDNYLW